MEEKTVFLGLRATPAERLAVLAYAAVKGLTVSELIRAEVVSKAVKPILDAVQADRGAPGAD